MRIFHLIFIILFLFIFNGCGDSNKDNKNKAHDSSDTVTDEDVDGIEPDLTDDNLTDIEPDTTSDSSEAPTDDDAMPELDDNDVDSDTNDEDIMQGLDDNDADSDTNDEDIMQGLDDNDADSDTNDEETEKEKCADAEGDWDADQNKCTRIVACTAIPVENAEWNGDSFYTQEYVNGFWTHETATEYSETAGTCRFKCAGTFFWNETACVNSCTDNPCAAINHADGCISHDMITYECTCAGSYVWDNETFTCKSPKEAECDQVGGMWDENQRKCSRITPCAAFPANAEWNGDSSYTQFYFTDAWTAGPASEYNEATGTCHFKCITNYFWNESECVSPCSTNPCEGLTNVEEVCTATGITTFLCGCTDGFHYDSSINKCISECSPSTSSSCYDSAGKLIWSEKTTDEMSLENAKTYCIGLNSSTYGGFDSGWRLPTISELRTLIQDCHGTISDGDCKVSDPNHLAEGDWTTDCLCEDDESGNYSKFKETSVLWSSSAFADDSNQAWGVNFGKGELLHNDLEHHVRCVRKEPLTIGNICTGQTECYDNSGIISCPELSDSNFYGQDAQYGTSCILQNFAAAAPVSNQPVVVDNNTGLIWEQSPSEETFTWDNAQSHCNNLNAVNYAGINNWRLPNPLEIITIVDSGTYTPSTNWIFKNMVADSSYLWTSRNYPLNATLAYALDVDAGSFYTQTKTNAYNVLCVSGKELQASVASDFETSQDDTTVTDKRTGLVWQKGYASSNTWRQALNYCQNLNSILFDGRSDWRLPDRNELASLLNYDKEGSPYSYFPNVRTGKFWSSSTVAKSPDTAWVVNYYGTVSIESKTWGCNTRCVRSAD